MAKRAEEDVGATSEERGVVVESLVTFFCTCAYKCIVLKFKRESERAPKSLGE